MPITALRSGAPPVVADELSADWLRCDSAEIDAVAIARLTIDALSEPVGLPALSQCLTPDDHVAIPVAPNMTAPSAVLGGVIASLVAAGVQPTRIRVVAANARDMGSIEAGLESQLTDGVVVESHDPACDEGLCFAGLAKGDRPLLVNRTLFEADVVLPVSAEATASVGSKGADPLYEGLFPDFFDCKTIERVHASKPIRGEAEEAGWAVGAPMVVRAIPGPGGGVSAVIAGAADRVVGAASEANQQAWETPLAEPADVVIAILTGGADQQTWASLGRALLAAERLVTPAGVIAVWSELAEPVGPKLARLADGDDRGDVEAELNADTDEEAVAATQLLRALERGPVFLHSQHDPDEMESLGLAPVSDAAEMLRLVRRFDSCNVLDEAQHVRFANEV